MGKIRGPVPTSVVRKPAAGRGAVARGRGQQSARGSPRAPTVIERAPSTKNLAFPLLKLFIESRWNSDSRLLDLSAMGAAEQLKSLRPNLNNIMFCSNLARAIADTPIAQGINTLNLAKNGLKVLQPLTRALKDHGVAARNISFADNDLSDITQIDLLQPLALREVVFTGNKICEAGASYAQHIALKLKTVEILDLQDIQEERVKVLPNLPVVGCLYRNADVLPVCEKIVAAVLQGADTGNFDPLLEVYDSNACFSMSLDPRCINSRANVALQQLYNYLREKTNNSHEITQLMAQKRPLRIARGRIEVVRFQKTLFKGMETVKWNSAHDLASLQPEFNLLELSPTQRICTCVIHGIVSFATKKDAQHKLSFVFDRTLLINWTPEKASVTNDCLMLRPWSNHIALYKA